MAHPELLASIHRIPKQALESCTVSVSSLMVKSWYAGTAPGQPALANPYSYLKYSRILNNLITVCTIPWDSKRGFMSFSVTLYLNTHLPLTAVLFPSVNCISLYYFLPTELPLPRLLRSASAATVTCSHLQFAVICTFH